MIGNLLANLVLRSWCKFDEDLPDEASSSISIKRGEGGWSRVLERRDLKESCWSRVLERRDLKESCWSRVLERRNFKESCWSRMLERRDFKESCWSRVSESMNLMWVLLYLKKSYD